MSDYFVKEGDRVFLETPDKSLLRLVFGETSVGLIAANIGRELVVISSSDKRAIGVEIKTREWLPCGCYGLECSAKEKS
jgi:hypothetical protein